MDLEVLRNLANETLEGQLADEKLDALLVTTDHTKSDCSRTITVRFLTPPVAGALFRAALVAICFLGALLLVDLRAVCFVRAISFFLVFYQRRCEQKIGLCKMQLAVVVVVVSFYVENMAVRIIDAIHASLRLFVLLIVIEFGLDFFCLWMSLVCFIRRSLDVRLRLSRFIDFI